MRVRVTRRVRTTHTVTMRGRRSIKTRRGIARSASLIP
jgi:hypothetical protein